MSEDGIMYSHLVFGLFMNYISTQSSTALKARLILCKATKTAVNHRPWRSGGVLVWGASFTIDPVVCAHESLSFTINNSTALCLYF